MNTHSFVWFFNHLFKLIYLLLMKFVHLGWKLFLLSFNYTLNHVILSLLTAWDSSTLSFLWTHSCLVKYLNCNTEPLWFSSYRVRLFQNLTWYEFLFWFLNCILCQLNVFFNCGELYLKILLTNQFFYDWLW